jgi:hypothetical protein
LGDAKPAGQEICRRSGQPVGQWPISWLQHIAPAAERDTLDRFDLCLFRGHAGIDRLDVLTLEIESILAG